MQGRMTEGTLGTHLAQVRETHYGVLGLITGQPAEGNAVTFAGFTDTSS